MPKKLIRMAISYDFDGTLAPGNMQEYDFIPALKIKPQAFWAATIKLAKEKQMDPILAYMYKMIDEAQSAKVSIHKADFKNFGKNIALFPGVSDWFSRINGYAKTKNIHIDHFVISSGIREMVEGTQIYKKFKKVYASGFMFDHNDIARWPALAINYTNKTQYLFRINKDSLDVDDNSVINKYVPRDMRPVPFENMIYVGDGETDIPCMRLVKDQGGHSISVYNPKKRKTKEIANRIVQEGRANLAVPADYSAGSAIENSVKAIIDKVEASSRIR